MSRYRCTRWVASALVALTSLAAAQDVPTQLIVVEQFLATGGEPTFWTASSVSDLVRTEGPERVEFGLRLRQIESVIGGNPPVRMVITEGSNRVTIGQDPATQAVEMPGDLPVVGFLNGLIERLGSVERRASWTEVVPVLSDVVPGFQEASVRADFTVDAVSVPYEGGEFELYDFRTEEVPFEVGDSHLGISYRGYALIDTERNLAYLGTFEQRGIVRTKNGPTEVRSELVHSTTFWLQDDLDQLLVPYESDSALLARQEQYTQRSRPEVGRLNPELLDPRPRPDWSTGVWVAGRLANAALGMVAEQATNPLPAMTLGTLLLTDESLSLAGNTVVDTTKLDRGEISEINPYDGDYPSPIQFAFSPEAQSSAAMKDRLSFLRPAEVQGAVEVGRPGDEDYRVFPLGGVAMATAAALLSNASSHIGFAVGGGAPVTVGGIATGSAATAGSTAAIAGGAAVAGGGIGTTAVVLGGAVVAGGAVALASESDDGGSTPPDPVQQCTGPEQFSGNVTANEVTSLTFTQLGEVAGTVTVDFDPFGGSQDRLDLFQGGQLVASTNALVGDATSLTFAYDPTVGPVTATVTAGPTPSLWVVVANCPQ